MGQKVVPEVYFGSPDRQMESFLDGEAFQRSLVLGMLFQGELVIPDIFFFISRHIRQLVLHDRKGTLTALIDQGAVIPSFRAEDGGSFARNYATIQGQQIQGCLPDAGAIADRLDEALADSKNYRQAYKVWPEAQLGEGFSEVVRQMLLTDQATADAPELAAAWQVTRAMREACVGDALSRATGGGLRRGDLYNSLAAHLKLDRPVIDDIRVILDGTPDLARRAEAACLLKWINYCYQYNQAVMLGLRPALSSMNETDLMFAQGFCRSEGDDTDAPVLQDDFPLPSVPQLLSVPMTELLGVRNGGAGVRYFQALARSQAAPSDDAAGHLLACLGAYADEISHLTVRKGRSLLNPRHCLQANVPTGRAGFRHMIRGVLFDAAGMAVHPLGMLTQAVNGVSTVFSLLPRSMQHSLSRPLGKSRRLRFEVTQRRLVTKERGGKETLAEGCFG